MRGVVRMASEWSLEGELCDMAGESKLESAVKELGLLPRSIQLSELRPSGPWRRGGNETYIYCFTAVGSGGWRRSLVLKAVVAFSPGASVGSIADQWVKRRELLAKERVNVPRLYAVRRATILEDYVPHLVSSALTRPRLRGPLLMGLIEYAAALARLRFRPMAPFSDLRTFGRTVVPVDFGEDLGPPGQAYSGATSPFYQLYEWLYGLGVDLPDGAVDIYSSLMDRPSSHSSQEGRKEQ
jgi:hypothetical protein